MSSWDKVLVFVSFLLLMGVVVGAAWFSSKQREDAEKLCHPFRVKFHFDDPDTSKLRAVCATSDGRDELR